MKPGQVVPHLRAIVYDKPEYYSHGHHTTIQINMATVIDNAFVQNALEGAGAGTGGMTTGDRGGTGAGPGAGLGTGSGS